MQWGILDGTEETGGWFDWGDICGYDIRSGSVCCDILNRHVSLVDW